jgi:4-aminobutyrate aminotransferase-like enzyme
MSQAQVALQQLVSPGIKTFSLTDDPPVFVGGCGATLIDTEDRRFIDMASGSSVMHVGYGNEAVLEALRRQIETGVTHIGPHFHTQGQIEFLQALRSVLPPSLDCLHPCTNGAEATEVAIKLCQYATGRRRFVTFQGSYHGRTAGALAVSAAQGKSEVLGPFLPAAQVLPYPDCESCGDRCSSGVCCLSAERALDALGSAGYGLTDLAGIFIEPVQGTGGVVVPPKGFLAEVARRARTLGVPLVFDEVFTAFGRTGSMFAFEREGVVPDVVLLAKSLGGGMPAGVLAASAEMLARVPKGAISSTFQLHPMAAAAGSAALKYTIEQNLPGRARVVEGWFRDAVSSFLGVGPVGSVRGIGALFGLQIVDGKGRPDPDICKRIRKRCLHGGLITYECGRSGEVLGLLPPLVISKDEFDHGVSILSSALTAY